MDRGVWWAAVQGIAQIQALLSTRHTLRFMSCLYILTCHHISHSIGCIFFCQWFFLLCKRFKFNYVLSVYFCFVSFALGDISKTYCYSLCQSILPMFFPRSFMVSNLTFRPLIQFELIFVYDVRKCSNLLLHVALQFSQHHFLKTFSLIYSCLLYCRLIDHKCVGLFLGSLFCYIALYVCFSAHIILF